MTAGNVKKTFYICGAVTFIAIAFVACSARKNNASSRFYHSLNARYNIYYNGKTSFDDALKSMNDGYKESYTQQICMFPISAQYKEEKTTSGGPFDRAIEKGNKAIKLHSIKDKPARKPGWQSDPKQVKLQQQEEFNPFIKNCWLLVAEGQFYNGDFLESAATFSYITRHFSTDPDLVAEARIWQARCYTELDWFYETNNTLKKLKESGVPSSQQKKYDKMYADFLIRSEQIKNAIPYLQKSIKAERNRRQRARMRYLLGQLYMGLGQNELAYTTFQKVASSNPPYDLEFAARIRETEVFPGGNYEKVLKMLNRMSKSDKNKNYLDQVYYAIGNVYMTRQDTAKAIENYSKGIEKSTQNGLDKAICQIRLGDIYFTQKKYVEAQPCFSGALSGIQKEYKEYDRIAKLSETLDELVVQYEAVHLQDSLQELARMPEKERLAAIDKIIEQVKEEEKKAEEEAKKNEYIAQQQSMGSNLNRVNQIKLPTISTGNGDNSFYFYNSQTVEQGKAQFQNKWGKRTLEDNWRRRDKKMTLLMEETDSNEEQTDSMSDEMTAKNDSLQEIKDSLASDNKSREYYLQQIPLTEDDMDASNIIIEDGLFNMGMIYKDKLEDMNLSVSTFEELERRFPDNKYRLDYYYQVYLMALRYKDTALAEEYKKKMLAEFPESDYTKAISDPNYEYNIRMMDSVQDSIYEATYNGFLAEDTSLVRNNYKDFSEKYPLAQLMPKFMFLNALTYVQAGDADGFKERLTILTEKYPEADVTELANEMLKGLLKGRKLMQGSFSSMKWDLRFGLDENETLSAADSALMFSNEQEVPYRMLLIYTTGSIERNQLLYAVAAYNFANFRVKGFDLSFEEMSSITILTISGFNNFKEVMDYYNMIYSKGGYASALDGIVTFFPFSDKNYDVLMHGKTLEEYMTFFIDNFGDVAPELVNRWRVRVDEDRKEIEEKNAAEEEKISQEESSKNEENSNIEQPPKEQHIEENKENPTERYVEKIEKIESPKIVSEKKEIEPKLLESTVENKELLEEDIEHPKAKGESFMKKLFKKVKDRKEYQTLEQGAETIKNMAQEEEAPVDTVSTESKPLERVDGELTFDQIKEIRQKENEQKAEQQKIETVSKEETQKAAAELKKQKAKEREELRKQKAKEAKQRLKQKEKERKAKEKEYKQRLKQKEKERKEKEAARRAAQKEKAKTKKK